MGSNPAASRGLLGTRMCVQHTQPSGSAQNWVLWLKLWSKAHPAHSRSKGFLCSFQGASTPLKTTRGCTSSSVNICSVAVLLSWVPSLTPLPPSRPSFSALCLHCHLISHLPSFLLWHSNICPRLSVLLRLYLRFQKLPLVAWQPQPLYSRYSFPWPPSPSQPCSPFSAAPPWREEPQAPKELPEEHGLASQILALGSHGGLNR